MSEIPLDTQEFQYPGDFLTAFRWTVLDDSENLQKEISTLESYEAPLDMQKLEYLVRENGRDVWEMLHTLDNT